MVLSIVILAVLAYALGMLDCRALVSQHVLGADLRKSGGISYPHLYQRFQVKGVLYALVADLVKAMVVVLIGGLLMKRAGFPSIGKQTAMLFALLGQAMPITDGLRPRLGLVAPALLLLWVDWRLFGICLVVALGLMLVTGDKAIGALGAAVAFPVFMLILGSWWLKLMLAVLCAATLCYVYWPGIRRFFRPRPKQRSGKPQSKDGETQE